MDTLDHIRRIVGPIDRRLRSLFMRATVTGVDDSKDLQLIQVARLDEEVLEGCERVGQYGFTSVPPDGAEALIAQVGGNADHQVVVGVDDRSRPHPLATGQVVVYDAAGTKITLDAAGNITIDCTGVVTVNCSAMSVGGVLTADDTLVGHGGALLNTLHVTGNVVIDGTLNGHAP